MKYILYFSYSAPTMSMRPTYEVQVSRVGVRYSAMRGNHPTETSSIDPETMKSTFSTSLRYS